MTAPDAAQVRPDVVGLVTLQWAYGGLFDAEPAAGYDVCLVTAVQSGGTPGPTLCGLDRFAPDRPGWSVGGGVTGGRDKPCAGCTAVARDQYPGVPVSGTFAHLFAGETGVGR